MSDSKPGVSYDEYVKYADLDPFKLEAQTQARKTDGNIAPQGFRVLPWSRGESAFLVDVGAGIVGSVEEGLGTKNMVAEAMRAIVGDLYFDRVAKCAVAMIVNDLVTLGVPPTAVAMHIASGEGAWFREADRADNLLRGWKRACDIAGCVWAGGETPTLRGLVDPLQVVLAGSAWGFVPKGQRIIEPNVQDGDVIILITSSGIHANGLTMCRGIADLLTEGYETKLPDGRTYGETLLDPTHIYVRAVMDCLGADVDVHYAVNITGHGWRKLMRLREHFTYLIHTLPPQLPIFDFLKEHGNMSDNDMYSDLNMGAGFALFVPREHVVRAVDAVNAIDDGQGLEAFAAGVIERTSDKKVVINPKGLVFHGDSLGVR